VAPPERENGLAIGRRRRSKTAATRAWVRKGSPVRVRQRALKESPATAEFLLSRFLSTRCARPRLEAFWKRTPPVRPPLVRQRQRFPRAFIAGLRQRATLGHGWPAGLGASGYGNEHGGLAVRLAALALASAALAPAQAHAFRHVVTPDGRVGTAHIGRSGYARVRAQEGRPARIRQVAGEGEVPGNGMDLQLFRRPVVALLL